MNATGLSWIDVTGVTKLGIREKHDYTNNSPGDNKNDGPNLTDDNSSGTTNDPYLIVVYTTGGGGGGGESIPNNDITIFE